MQPTTEPAASEGTDDCWSECNTDAGAELHDAADARDEAASTVREALGTANAAFMMEAQLRGANNALQEQLRCSQQEVSMMRETIRMHEATVDSMRQAERQRELKEQSVAAAAARPCERCCDKDVRIVELESVVRTLPGSTESGAAAVALLERQLKQLQTKVAQSEERCESAKLEAGTVRGERNAMAAKLAAEQARVQELAAQVRKLSDVTVAVALKSEHVKRHHLTNKKCAKCEVVLTPCNWFCCHTCEDWNYCRGCFEGEGAKHASGTHSFTDMEIFKNAIVNTTLSHVVEEITNTNFALCDRCDKRLYPTKGEWLRCNECEDTDFCASCFERYRSSHFGGTHTFTDMSSLVESKHGFPKIVNDAKSKALNTRYILATYDGCGTRTGNSFFHCNQCNDYDLCPRCILTDSWRNHSGTAVHTFTAVRHTLGSLLSDD